MEWICCSKRRELTTNLRRVTSQKSGNLIYTRVEACNHSSKTLRLLMLMLHGPENLEWCTSKRLVSVDISTLIYFLPIFRFTERTKPQSVLSCCRTYLTDRRAVDTCYNSLPLIRRNTSKRVIHSILQTVHQHNVNLWLWWQTQLLFMSETLHLSVAYRGGFGGVQTPRPRNSEVLTKLSRIPSSVENTSVTT
jgi:hypothetical protein